MENKTYEYEIDREQITVTTEEVLSFYPEQHSLTEAEIEEYAAKYTAWIKQKRKCNVWLDKNLVQRLLDEERLIKNGGTDSFKLQLHFTWYITIKKETLGVFKYTVNAYCLDNRQSHERRYTTLEKAILYCLNAFNENISIQDKYRSLKQYLSEK